MESKPPSEVIHWLSDRAVIAAAMLSTAVQGTEEAAFPRQSSEQDHHMFRLHALVGPTVLVSTRDLVSRLMTSDGAWP